MSAVNEKKTDGPQPAVHHTPWYSNPPNMNMYNMYNPYMYPPGYGAQGYYPYYQQQQGMPPYMNQNQQIPQDNQQFRNFMPGGQLTPFQPGPPMNHQPAPPQTNQTSATNPKAMELSDDLPPLPPGPPPHKPAANMPAQANHMNNNVIQSGPVKFMMNNARAKMNMQGNAFNQQQMQQQQNQNQNNQQGGGNSKKKKKKKNKQARQQMMLQQKLQQFQWSQNQQVEQVEDCPPLPDSEPPLPPGSPPPLPPLPSPSMERNENNVQPNNINLPPPMPSNPFSPTFPNHVPPMQPPLPAQPAHLKGLDEWPASLRDYVSRCYAKCVNQLDKDRVGVILKGKLIRATNDGTLWTKDWNEEPMPMLESDPTALKNFKDKIIKNNLTSRLGAKNPTPIRRQRSSLPTKGSGRSTYRSDSSSSRSSRSSSSSRRTRSRSRSPRSYKKSNRNPNKKSRGNHNNSRRNNQKSHFYSEFGAFGGSEDFTVKKEVLDKRAARFNTSSTKTSTLASSIGNRLGTREGFGGNKKKQGSLFVYDNGPSSPSSNGGNNGDYEVSDLHIIGTCEDLEKAYLRLTAAPEAAQVRPRSVLIKSLEMVKIKWIKDRDYRYAFEQLKSIRQDLTVQGIRDALSVEVYETHARIALEMKDHAEFNQCQSQLRILHNEVSEAASNKQEFKAYGILFFIFTKDFMELSTLLSALSDEDKQDECISHAVELARAFLVGTRHRIFKLYKTAPKMSSYLIDLFIERERIDYFKVIMRAYRPSIPLDFIKSELELDADTDLEAFLTSVGNVSFVDSSRTLIDCKAFQG